MHKRTWLALAPVAVGLLTLGVFSTRAAESKETIVFQCRLAQNGTPLSGSLTLTLRIYDSQAGGSLLHTEVDSVTVSHGLVSTVIGDENDGNGPLENVLKSTSGDLYVSVFSGTTDLIGSRIRLNAVPFSLRAEVAAIASQLWDGNSGTGFSLSSLDARYVQQSTSGSDPLITGGATELLIIQANADGAYGVIRLQDTVEVSGSIAVVGSLTLGGVAYLEHQTSSPSGKSNHVALYAKDDKLYLTTSAGVEAEVGSGAGSGSGDPAYTVNGFRLTLESGAPVSGTDQSGKSTLYLTPYKSNEIWTKDSGTWTRHTSGQISLILSSLTTDANYDVFVKRESSALALELSPAWTGATTRTPGTDIAREDGVWVKKSGGGTVDASRRYVGTLRATGATTTEDSAQKRFLWNADNRVRRVGASRSSTSTWTYASTTLRQMNLSGNPPTPDPAFRYEFIRGLDEDPIEAYLSVGCQGTFSASYTFVAIAFDNTAFPDTTHNAFGSTLAATAGNEQITIEYQRPAAAGYHYLQALESTGGATSTFYGNQGHSIMRVTITN